MTMKLAARAVLTTMFCLALSGSPVAAAGEKAIKLTQTHYFFGRCILTIARNGFRMENQGNLKFIVVAGAPDWTVYIFRNDDRSYYSETMKQFYDTGLVSDFLVGRKERSLLLFKDMRKADFDFNGYKAIRLTGARRTFKYLPLSSVLNADPQVEIATYAAYKMPTGGGIPLSFAEISLESDFLSTANTAGSRQEYMSTSKIEAIEVSPGIFTMPKNYKKAQSVRAVVSGETSRKQSEEAFETIGGGGEPQRIGK